MARGRRRWQPEGGAAGGGNEVPPALRYRLGLGCGVGHGLVHGNGSGQTLSETARVDSRNEDI